MKKKKTCVLNTVTKTSLPGRMDPFCVVSPHFFSVLICLMGMYVGASVYSPFECTLQMLHLHLQEQFISL